MRSSYNFPKQVVRFEEHEEQLRFPKHCVLLLNNEPLRFTSPRLYGISKQHTRGAVTMFMINDVSFSGKM